MVFTRIRTINGNEYMYEEYRWRGANGKVKSKSICLGRIGGSAPPVNMNSQQRRHKKSSPGIFGIDWKGTIVNEPGAKAMEEWEAKANALAKQERQRWETFKAKEASRAKDEQEECDRTITDRAVARFSQEKAPASDDKGSDNPAADKSVVTMLLHLLAAMLPKMGMGANPKPMQKRQTYARLRRTTFVCHLGILNSLPFQPM